MTAYERMSYLERLRFAEVVDALTLATERLVAAAGEAGFTPKQQKEADKLLSQLKSRLEILT